MQGQLSKYRISIHMVTSIVYNEKQYTIFSRTTTKMSSILSMWIQYSPFNDDIIYHKNAYLEKWMYLLSYGKRPLIFWLPYDAIIRPVKLLNDVNVIITNFAYNKYGTK